jgi:hypothetical protein
LFEKEEEKQMGWIPCSGSSNTKKIKKKLDEVKDMHDGNKANPGIDFVVLEDKK